MYRRDMAIVVGAFAAIAFGHPQADAAEWEAFLIRDANASPALTPVTAVEDADGNGVIVLVDESGEKAGYGTAFFDGMTLGDIPSVSYTRRDSNPSTPYINIWITDGTNAAVIAPHVLSAGGGLLTPNINGADFQSLGIAIYETDYTDLDWIQAGAQRSSQQLVDSSGDPLLIKDISNIGIGDPGIGNYSNDVGSGAPKNGTGFNIIFGDSQNNFAQIAPYSIDNVQVPEPAGVLLIGMVAGPALLRRRRRIDVKAAEG